MNTPTQDELTLVKAVVGKMYELGTTVEFVPPIITGPRLTYFGLKPTGATKVTRLEETSKDIAVYLGVENVLIKRMPGQGVVGVFVPRRDPQLVKWMDLLGSPSGAASLVAANIPLLLGIDWQGRTIVDDLAECPHLLIAGATGGGKSVIMRSILATIIKERTASQIQLVLSDTKGVEFNDFDGCGLLRYPRATSPMQTITNMTSLCEEVDHRLGIYGSFGCKNIKEWNASQPSKMPYIVLLIDELADIVDLPTLKGKAAKIGVEKLDYLTRKARATGIHVIAGIQRPDAKIIQGFVKNNFPTRLSFKMGSGTDSKVILDTTGAEYLMEHGDCLYKGPAAHGGLLRLHTGLATTNDIKGVLEYVNFTKQQGFGNEQRHLPTM